MDVLDRDARPFPKVLPDFQRFFPDDAACCSYLEKTRWGDDFIYPHCGNVGEPFRFTAPSTSTDTAERRMAREMVGADEFIEIFVDTSLEKCEHRDAKGLYAKARAGEIKNFTCIDSAYEAPQSAEIHINGDDISAEQAAEKIVAILQQRGILHL